MLALPAFTGAPEVNRVYNVDALTLLAALEPQSVDAIITDLPYGTTACSWDEVIPFTPMWAAVKRVLKPRGVFVTTASQPFTSALVMSNPKCFRYEWVWNKLALTGFLDAKRRPLRKHENILVFSNESPAYYPQMSQGKPYTHKENGGTGVYSHFDNVITISDGLRYPTSIVEFSNHNHENKQHPTEKPVTLYEYLINTYTQSGELVLDFCCGSGTTGVAARNTGRRYILGDRELEYVEIAQDRLRQPWDKRRTKESDLSALRQPTILENGDLQHTLFESESAS